jgi:energy-coupling factor transporter ATP-binding protein EcfA2
MEIHQTKNVFTPTKPARIAFIDREAINDRLVNALEMPGKQLIVYGHSGSGKTTLLANKLHQLYEEHITTHCMKGMTFDQLVLDAFDQLGSFYTSEKTSAQKNTVSVDLVGTYLSIQSKISSSETIEKSKKEQRVIPPQLTPQALGKLLGAAKCCWILEDFHKMDDSEKTRLSQLMKVFMDLSDYYGDLKIVALGAVDTARQVVEYDAEMRNRVAEIRVDLMTEPEIESIVAKGEKALNISFSSDLKMLIARYSNGLASVCHHLCMYMCQAAGVRETCLENHQLDQGDFEAALKLYVEEASDSIRSAFDKAFKQRRKTKFDHTSIVLEALSTFKERGASRVDLLNKINKKQQKYPESSLKTTLQKLATDDYGAIIRFDQTSGLCSFSDPIYRVFAMAHFHKNGQSHVTGELDLTKFLKMLEVEMSKGLPNGTRIVIKANAPR